MSGRGLRWYGCGSTWHAARPPRAACSGFSGIGGGLGGQGGSFADRWTVRERRITIAGRAGAPLSQFPDRACAKGSVPK